MEKVKNDMEKVKLTLKQVSQEGLNIYALLNKLKKILNWKSDRKFPPEVIEQVCNSYLKNKDRIHRQWPWFIEAFKKASAQYFAKKNIEKSQEYKKATFSLKKIMEMSK